MALKGVRMRTNFLKFHYFRVLDGTKARLTGVIMPSLKLVVFKDETESLIPITVHFKIGFSLFPTKFGETPVFYYILTLIKKNHDLLIH